MFTRSMTHVRVAVGPITIFLLRRWLEKTTSFRANCDLLLCPRSFPSRQVAVAAWRSTSRNATYFGDVSCPRVSSHSRRPTFIIVHSTAVRSRPSSYDFATVGKQASRIVRFGTCCAVIVCFATPCSYGTFTSLCSPSYTGRRDWATPKTTLQSLFSGSPLYHTPLMVRLFPHIVVI